MFEIKKTNFLSFLSPVSLCTCQIIFISPSAFLKVATQRTLAFCQRARDTPTNDCLSVGLWGQSQSQEPGAARASADLRDLPRQRAEPSQAKAATWAPASPTSGAFLPPFLHTVKWNRTDMMEMKGRERENKCSRIMKGWKRTPPSAKLPGWVPGFQWWYWTTAPP